jgi:hypothetical protein
MNCKILFIVSLIVRVSYCNAQQLYSAEVQKSYLPQKELKFNLSKKLFALNDTSIISCNATYVLSEYLCGEKCDSLYTYMRFFNDGRLFVSFPYLSYPGAKEFNDLNYGRYGRYIVKDGIIKTELYINKHDDMMYMFAKPVSNGIQFYKTTGRGIGQVMKVSKGTDAGLYKKDYTLLYN